MYSPSSGSAGVGRVGPGRPEMAELTRDLPTKAIAKSARQPPLWSRCHHAAVMRQHDFRLSRSPRRAEAASGTT
eukprot:5510958-Prymnesium_polylepis.1